MARLIDADALIERIVAESNEPELDCDYYVGYHNGLTMAQAMVINAPTIEAEPVRHGHWKWNIAKTRPLCSECAEEPYRASNNRLPNFCPNCGAKMNKEEA